MDDYSYPVIPIRYTFGHLIREIAHVLSPMHGGRTTSLGNMK